jgi:hypothetical protein
LEIYGLAPSKITVDPILSFTADAQKVVLFLFLTAFKMCSTYELCDKFLISILHATTTESHQLCPSMTTSELLSCSEIPMNSVVANDTDLSPSVKAAALLPDSKLSTYNFVNNDTELSPSVTTTADFIMPFATDPQKVVISKFLSTFRLCSVKTYELYIKILLTVFQTTTMESHELSPSITTPDLLPSSKLSPSMTTGDLLPQTKLPMNNVVHNDTNFCSSITTTELLASSRLSTNKANNDTQLD